MFRALGWAAFLASVTSVLTFGVAQAGTARPTYACFSAQNAAVIARLGADDPSVRYGFETGECLALAPGTRIGDVGSTGRSTGPHLHYEVFRNNRVLNPKQDLPTLALN